MAPPNEPRPLTGDPNDGQVAIHQLAPEPTFGFLLPDPGNLFASKDQPVECCNAVLLVPRLVFAQLVVVTHWSRVGVVVVRDTFAP